LKIPRGSPPKISVFPACLKLHKMSNAYVTYEKNRKVSSWTCNWEFFKQMSIMPCLRLVWAHEYISKYSFKSHFIIEQCNKEGNF
jgi:hypothetical protein